MLLLLSGFIFSKFRRYLLTLEIGLISRCCRQRYRGRRCAAVPDRIRLVQVSRDRTSFWRGSTNIQRFVNGYVTTGARFVYGNVVIRMTRIYISVPTESEHFLASAPPSRENLKLLDPSGTYLVEATVRAEDNSSSTIREKAMEELLGFAKTIEGAIDFHVPDRLALETKVKGT